MTIQPNEKLNELLVDIHLTESNLLQNTELKFDAIEEDQYELIEELQNEISFYKDDNLDELYNMVIDLENFSKQQYDGILTTAQVILEVVEEITKNTDKNKDVNYLYETLQLLDSLGENLKANSEVFEKENRWIPFSKKAKESKYHDYLLDSYSILHDYYEDNKLETLLTLSSWHIVTLLNHAK